MTRDRKDVPHDFEREHAPVHESDREKAERKRRASEALDEALEETLPASDPVSPFVPAVRSTEASEAEAQSCAHEKCRCIVVAPERWCSEVCRESQQGYAENHGACRCGHDACLHTVESSGD